ncbi:hypothetical protein QR680_011997 [Steinernema hermaphroditum]|uniref:C2H2-type domain-containing protein n=1 Tax=Steinernema hermaphroditum TaxID=289476 RepID=A0AA39I2U7_9BILA|nr:hypothetical protein QR680_011997 [Steinernema hermaphroditum]
MSDSYYSFEELETLAELANHGTYLGQQMPKIMRDAAQTYQKLLLRQLTESIERLDAAYNQRVGALKKSNQGDSAETMGEEGDFYTLEELELLSEVATRGTMEGRKMPKIMRDSATHYRRHLLDQLKDQVKEVDQSDSNALEEITETVGALTAPVFPFTGYILEHSNEYSSEDDEEERLERIAEENDVIDMEDDSTDVMTIESDDEDVQRGQSAEGPTATAEFRSGLWQCQVCQKQLIKNHERDLLKHIGTHVNIFCRCPIAGCAKTCRTANRLRHHLTNYHKLRAADLSTEQHGRLLETERKFYESARIQLDRYFPPGANLQQQADHEASTSNTISYVALFKAEKVREKNWEIDHTERLTKYLDHLDLIDGGISRAKRKRKHEEVGQSGDEAEEDESSEDSKEDADKGVRRNKINFAEAAAVIQGCAEIYSKKVEYVYQRTMKFQTAIEAQHMSTVGAVVLRVQNKAFMNEFTDPEFTNCTESRGMSIAVECIRDATMLAAPISQPAVTMGEEAFYTFEDLELLAEVATRGTMEGQRVPKIMWNSAKHYRRHLLDQMRDEAEQVDQNYSNVLEEINETVAALAAPVFPFISIVGYILGHSNEYPYSSEDDMEDDSTEAITIESDDEDDQRGQSAEATTPTAEFRSGLWQCQICPKRLVGSHEADLLRHIGTHENILCCCPIAGCVKVCRTTSGIRSHLKVHHKLRAADLSAEQHCLLLETERKFYESARIHFDRYFPPGAMLQGQADHKTST